MNFARQRQAGFLLGMADAGLPVAPEYMVYGNLDRRGGYAAGQQLLALPQRPTAILVDNNLGGVGVMRALLQAGVAIGREISVIVYDGVPPDTLLLDQEVAAVVQPTAHASGRALAEMLLGQIQGTPAAQSHVLKQPHFVSGRSLGPVSDA
jgi:LacI family transcriptional regulator